MKIIFNYESNPEQVIQSWVLCAWCGENIKGTQVEEECPKCGEILDEDDIESEDMSDFFDTARMDDKIAGLFFEVHNEKFFNADENSGQFLYYDSGIEVRTANITIKGEITFDGDDPDDDTIITLHHFFPEKRIETVKFKELKDDCSIDSNFPDEMEIERRIEILTNDWSTIWKKDFQSIKVSEN